MIYYKSEEGDVKTKPGIPSETSKLGHIILAATYTTKG